MQIKPQEPVVVVVVVACTIGQGSVHTNAFSLVCVFVVIENAPTDSRPHYRFDAFLTVHTKTFENDKVARCDIS